MLLTLDLISDHIATPNGLKRGGGGGNAGEGEGGGFDKTLGKKENMNSAE